MPGQPVGGVTIALPEHPPQRFALKSDLAAGYATLSGEGQQGTSLFTARAPITMSR